MFAIEDRQVREELFRRPINIPIKKIFRIRRGSHRIVAIGFIDTAIIFFPSTCARYILNTIINQHICVVQGIAVKASPVFYSRLLIDEINNGCWQFIRMVSEPLVNIGYNRVINRVVCFCVAADKFFFINTLRDNNSRVDKNNAQQQGNDNKYRTPFVSSKVRQSHAGQFGSLCPFRGFPLEISLFCIANSF